MGDELFSDFVSGAYDHILPVQAVLTQDLCTAATFELGQSPTTKESQAVGDELFSDFVSKEVDKVELIYTKFVSLIASQPVVQTLLPLTPQVRLGSVSCPVECGVGELPVTRTVQRQDRTGSSSPTPSSCYTSPPSPSCRRCCPSHPRCALWRAA